MRNLILPSLLTIVCIPAGIGLATSEVDCDEAVYNS